MIGPDDTSTLGSDLTGQSGASAIEPETTMLADRPDETPTLGATVTGVSFVTSAADADGVADGAAELALGCCFAGR